MSTSNANDNINDLQSLVQVLVITPSSAEKSKDAQFALKDASLWMGPKKMIVEKLGLANKPEDPKLPSPGLFLSKDFPPESNFSQEEIKATKAAAQLMLKARKLSQLWAQSWLEGEYLEAAHKDERLSENARLTKEQYQECHKHEEKNRLMRALFFTALEEPDSYWIHLPGLSDIIQDFKNLDRDGMPEDGFISDQKEALMMLARVLQEKNLPREKQIRYAKIRNILSRVILPFYPAWDLLRFSMLISGQVFIDRGNRQYERLIEPIVSTYDICINYAFSKITWDSTLGCVEIEASKPGTKFPRPGYYRTLAAYPPRPLPHDPTTTPKKIFWWATAKDEYTFQPKKEPDSYPFYPPKDDKGKYVSNYVDFIAPPYPYMPVSSC